MMQYMCAVFDVKAEAFSVPVFVKAKGLAVRSFIDAVNGQPSDLSAHPEDFSLYCVATFDELSGAIIPIDVPEKLIDGASIRATKDN